MMSTPVIFPGRPNVFHLIRDTISAKNLIYYLTIRQISSKYKQTLLGVSWVIAQPLISLLMFYFLLGRVAKLNTGNIPYSLYLFSGIVFWNFFAQTVTTSAMSLVGNSQIIQKVYFPRLSLVVSCLFAALIDFIFAFAILVIFNVYMGALPGFKFLALPLFVIPLGVYGLALGTLLAAINVFYRDVTHITQVLIQLIMYASPVVYHPSSVPEKFALITKLNPLVPALMGLRWSLYGGELSQNFWIQLQISILLSVVFCFLVFMFFCRVERHFSDKI